MSARPCRPRLQRWWRSFKLKRHSSGHCVVANLAVVEVSYTGDSEIQQTKEQVAAAEAEIAAFQKTATERVEATDVARRKKTAALRQAEGVVTRWKGEV